MSDTFCSHCPGCGELSTADKPLEVMDAANRIWHRECALNALAQAGSPAPGKATALDGAETDRQLCRARRELIAAMDLLREAIKGDSDE
jgi:hypothetical protein